MSDNRLILVGYSGHGYVVADAAKTAGLNLGFYSEIKENIINPFKLTYLGNEQAIGFIGWEESYDFILGIGENSIRQKLGSQIVEKKGKVISVIHPSAEISVSTKWGQGVFFSKNVSVNPMAEIGDFVILNTGAIIEHECKIGTAAHIGPGAVLAGNVEIGERSFVGANAVIKQGVVIGNDVIIGAGSVVLKNIESGMTVVGNPAKRI